MSGHHAKFVWKFAKVPDHQVAISCCAPTVFLDYRIFARLPYFSVQHCICTDLMEPLGLRVFGAEFGSYIIGNRASVAAGKFCCADTSMCATCGAKAVLNVAGKRRSRPCARLEPMQTQLLAAQAKNSGVWFQLFTAASTAQCSRELMRTITGARANLQMR